MCISSRATTTTVRPRSTSPATSTIPTRQSTNSSPVASLLIYGHFVCKSRIFHLPKRVSEVVQSSAAMKVEKAWCCCCCCCLLMGLLNRDPEIEQKMYILVCPRWQAAFCHPGKKRWRFQFVFFFFGFNRGKLTPLASAFWNLWAIVCRINMEMLIDLWTWPGSERNTRFFWLWERKKKRDESWFGESGLTPGLNAGNVMLVKSNKINLSVEQRDLSCIQ